MTSTMDQNSLSSLQEDEQHFNLREWALKASVSRETTNSRRFSASNIRSSREETRSFRFRSNTTISSAASSPGYTLKDHEIDPSTYSFTTALKALQARAGYGWECLSPDGFALNSKWNEAEKYICNPLSGEVPMECLSAKTLSGRSITTSTSRITMSGPLVYYSNPRFSQTIKPTKTTQEEEIGSPIQEKKVEILTRDVGTQSTPPDLSSSSPSPSSSTPSIKERSLLECCEVDGVESPNSGTKSMSEEEIEEKEERKKEEATRKEEERKKEEKMCKCSQGGCFSLRSLLMRKRQRGKHSPRCLVLFRKRTKE